MSVDMDTIELDSLLDDCLDRMRRGEDLESCLTSHPDHAEELRSLLIVATDLTQIEVPRTSQQAKEAGRQRMFAAFEAGQSTVSKSNQTIPVSIVGIIRYLEQVQAMIQQNLSKEFLVMHKAVIAIVLVLVMLFGGSAASAYAAQGSLPGDALYPMKAAIEDVSADFSMDSTSEVRLYLRLAEKRIAEIESLAAEGRYEDMEKAVERFESHIEKAIVGLLVVAQGNPAEAKALAATLGELMERHAQVLLALMVAAPDEVQATFEDAVEASQEGISAAGEFADDGEANENSDAVNENENADDDDDDGNVNSDDDNGNDDDGNVNGDDDNGDDDDGNFNGDDDDGDDEDENVNGDDEDESDSEDEDTNGDEEGDEDDGDEDDGESDSEDENTNGDDEDESEDENTNGDDDSEENTNENVSDDENANGEEDDMNDNGDDSSNDDSDDADENDNGDTGDGEENSNESGDEEANENDNTGEDEDSSEEGDESGNENDSGEEESNENDNGSEDDSNENDNSESEDEEIENDNGEEDENTNS